MKGQIPLIEMITISIILFITFSIFFPQGGFENRWDDANVILKGRDMVITIDRIGIMDQSVSNSSALSQFLNKTLPDQSLISWSSVDGTIQPFITVACNCSTQEVDNFINAVGRLKLNGRDVEIDFIKSGLSPIQESDLLLIPRENNLGPYKESILDYLDSGNGVVSFANVPDPNSDYVEIFGIDRCVDIGLSSCTGSGSSELEFVIPSDVDDASFQMYKIFHGLPIRSVNTGLYSSPIPIQDGSGLASCPIWPVPEGSLSFKTTDARYWVCYSSSSVYIDTNGDQRADIVKEEGDSFSIGSFNFVLNYLESSSTFSRIFVSMKPGFRFDDFRPPGVQIFPTNLENNRVVLKDGTYANGRPIPVVTINSSLSGNAIWAPEDLIVGSSEDSDIRLLLASIILTASNKDSKDPFIGNLQIGFRTPYINIVNKDMFEVYQFNLGLGFPF